MPFTQNEDLKVHARRNLENTVDLNLEKSRLIRVVVTYVLN